MKILVIGDFHGKFPKKLKEMAKKVDLVLCTGDFGGSEKLLKILFKYLGKKWNTKELLEKLENPVDDQHNSCIIRDLRVILAQLSDKHESR